MNTLHDMGGIEGLGPIVPEPDGVVHYDEWELKVHALITALGFFGRWNIDAFRWQVERIPGQQYLILGYYEKWLRALIGLCVERGLLTAEEVATGHAQNPGAAAALTVAQVPAALNRGTSTARPATRTPAFAAGQRVRTRVMNVAWHTRLPRYARGKNGVVVSCEGSRVFPDTNSRFLGEQPQPMYLVRFDMVELWGADRDPRDTIVINLWEDYLEQP